MDSDFFPNLSQREDKPHIWLQEDILVNWPQTEEDSSSRLAHYSNKGPESHFTRVSHDAFSGLSVGSLFLVFKREDAPYTAICIDSESECFDFAISIFSLPESPLFGISSFGDEPETESTLIEIVAEHLRHGTIEFFISESELPSMMVMSSSARKKVMESIGIGDLSIDSVPRKTGDLLERMYLEEFESFKEYETKYRGSIIAKELATHSTESEDISHVVSKMAIHGYESLFNLFKGAQQARKSRAGGALENHLSQFLLDRNICFVAQPSIDTKKSPDFLIPSVERYNDQDRDPDDVLILQAKTSLRERWNQILVEGARTNTKYLATLDKTVSANQRASMVDKGVVLVVPEKTKKTWYPTDENVISLDNFWNLTTDHRAPCS